MSFGEMFLSGLSAVFSGGHFLMVLLAIVLGTIFGALPGVSATMAVALGLTFTYTMSPVPAIVFLVAIYCSSITGGSITAILFKIPGVPSSAPTTFDGYPMAKEGKAGKALGVALFCSAIGGLFSAIVMFAMSSPLSKAALAFGQGDLFAITFLGLSILTVLDMDHILTTIISGLLGLLLACIGQDPMAGVARLTFGNSQLLAGIEMIPVLIGLFAVTEVLKQTNAKKRLSAEDGVAGTKGRVNTKMPSLREMWSIKWVMLRCSIVGTIVGILPGAGATIASFMCYAMENKLSKYPEKFGTGIIDCASEYSFTNLVICRITRKQFVPIKRASIFVFVHIHQVDRRERIIPAATVRITSTGIETQWHTIVIACTSQIDNGENHFRTCMASQVEQICKITVQFVPVC